MTILIVMENRPNCKFRDCQLAQSLCEGLLLSLYETVQNIHNVYNKNLQKHS